jgi:hypothetical protein
MGDFSAVAFREVATEHSKDHSGPGTDNHEENPGCNSSCEVRKEEDSNSRVHQNRQHSSRNALRHVSTSRACAAAEIYFAVVSHSNADHFEPFRATILHILRRPNQLLPNF